MSCTSEEQNEETIKKLENGHFSIQHNDLSFVIDPTAGGRILSAKVGEGELLLQKRDSLVNWGSTFWSAPQSVWNWPPPAAISVGKYRSEVIGDMLVMESEVDEMYKFSVRKTMELNPAKNGLKIQYEITNAADSVQSMGPWEVTCVPGGGSVFFPIGQSLDYAENNLEFDQKEDIAWFTYDPDRLKEWQKLFNNVSEGWLTFIDDNGLLFIKSFEKIPSDKLAPEQGNVEVFINKPLKYIELENHGRYTRLEPGESFTYSVYWYLSQLPKGINANEYSEELIKHVRDMIQ